MKTKEQKAEYKRRWYLANRERLREYRRNYYLEHKLVEGEQSAKYYEEHKHDPNIISARKRAMMRYYERQRRALRV